MVARMCSGSCPSQKNRANAIVGHLSPIRAATSRLPFPSSPRRRRRPDEDSGIIPSSKTLPLSLICAAMSCRGAWVPASPAPVAPHPAPALARPDMKLWM